MAFTTIDDSEAYFQVQLYTGNGSADNSITLGGSTDMQPDFVWIKNRDASDIACMFDAARGVTKLLTPTFQNNPSVAETTDTDTLDAFETDGFRVDADVKVNTNAEKYVAWCWLAGGGAGSSNTTGEINTTTTSVNTTSGISISTYTGTGSAATIGHGLGAVPHTIWVKDRSDAGNWRIYHHKNTAAPETDYLQFDSTATTVDSATVWNDTAPTSTVFSIGTEDNVNESGDSIIAYCFTEIQGFSKFGSFIGSGDADGPFVYTGFKPAYLFFKSDGVFNWHQHDNKRETSFNVVTGRLNVNTVSAEDTPDYVDFLSNGFKARVTSTEINGSGTRIHYWAWAEAPFVNSNGVPGTAR